MKRNILTEDDPVRGHVLGWAKEYGISQAAFDKLVGDVVAMGGDQQVQMQRTIAEEKAALGPNADAIINGMTDCPEPSPARVRGEARAMGQLSGARRSEMRNAARQ